MQTKRGILAKSVTIGLLLGSFTGPVWAKVPDVVAKTADEFQNFTEASGTGLAKGKGVAVVSGEPILIFLTEIWKLIATRSRKLSALPRRKRKPI